MIDDRQQLIAIEDRENFFKNDEIPANIFFLQILHGASTLLLIIFKSLK